MHDPVEVLLNVYDIQQKSSLTRLNTVTRDLGIGGIFHGAIQLGGAEFSFGWCEAGSGVYAVHPTQNPMYQFRETISLGHTSKSLQEIKAIIQELKVAWPGSGYDLLTRNCCHFCEVLAAQLGVAPVPAWLNRFASGAAATVSLTQETVKTVHGIGAELSRLSGESLGLLKAGWSRAAAAAAQQQQQLAERMQQQRSIGGPNNSGSSSSSSLRPAGGGGSSSSFSSATAAAGASLLSGMAHAREQLKATTSKLIAQAAAPKGPAAAESRAAAGGASSTWQQPTGQHSEDQQQHQPQQSVGLMPGVQPKLGRQFCLVNGQEKQPTNSTDSELEAFAALLLDDGAAGEQQRPAASGAAQQAAQQQQQQQHTKPRQEQGETASLL